MTHAQTLHVIPGIHCAERLLRAGATRVVVIPALRREIGLTEDEAGAALDGALAKIDSEYPYRTAATHVPGRFA